VQVISTTYLKHTDKEDPETVKAMVKMQACTMLYKMGLSHFSLFIYCLFLLWFCRHLQLIWLSPPHPKKKILDPREREEEHEQLPFPFPNTKCLGFGRNKTGEKSIHSQIDQLQNK
jgi:hypothetical protein